MNKMSIGHCTQKSTPVPNVRSVGSGYEGKTFIDFVDTSRDHTE